MSLLRDAGDHVYVLTMADEAMRFNPTTVDAIGAALDEFDAVDGPKALVTTGSGKFYNIGLDLDWLRSEEAKEEASTFFPALYSVWGRILFSPAPTVAAINGHAIAAGAMTAACHDHRIMRSDRGYWAINEVDLDMPLTVEMTALLQARLPPTALHEAVVTGRRWVAADLVANDMMEAEASEADVLTKAMERAATEAHHAGNTLAVMKRQLYPIAYQLLVEANAQSTNG